ncbi:MAG: alpha/beta hydrolase, partial [Phenylobacterium sp.]|nr:alpha/beta hydrolase [Phenylobacterium sp.]
MRTRLIKTDGLVQQMLEAGFEDLNAPLVLLIHGFPELGISWRAQVEALSAAGYHVVAPDMRGYGGTDKPKGVDACSILHLVGDMVDLVRALGKQSAVVDAVQQADAARHEAGRPFRRGGGAVIGPEQFPQRRRRISLQRQMGVRRLEPADIEIAQPGPFGQDGHDGRRRALGATGLERHGQAGWTCICCTGKAMSRWKRRS